MRAAEFAALMDRLGPFEPAPRLAAAVSGGPDSMALALLSHRWAAARGGTILALIVDHGLRPESSAEATLTCGRLQAKGVAGRVLTLHGLRRGPRLAERARAARYTALEAACAEAGCLHLLLGHQAADQAETVLIRTLAGSGVHGLAGMAALVERPFLRLLRPLLDIPPGRLRETLHGAGWSWVEDPSNTDRAATRPRLRALRLDREGQGPATRALVQAARADGLCRAEDEAAWAAGLAACVALRPEGFAVLRPGTMPAALLARVVAAVSGHWHPVSPDRVAALAARPQAATIAGAQVVPAGRLGLGWLVLREAGAMEGPVPALPGAVWDRRFRLARVPEGGKHGLRLSALADDAPRFRRLSPLPSAVLRTIPAIRDGARVVAVPHLLWPDQAGAGAFPCLFSPARPAGPAPFVPA